MQDLSRYSYISVHLSLTFENHRTTSSIDRLTLKKYKAKSQASGSKHEFTNTISAKKTTRKRSNLTVNKSNTY